MTTTPNALEQLKHAIAASPELQDRLKSVENGPQEEIVTALREIADELGISISADDFNKHFERGELSDEDLESVSGGAWRNSFANWAWSLATAGFVCAGLALTSHVRAGNADKCQADGQGSPR